MRPAYCSLLLCLSLALASGACGDDSPPASNDVTASDVTTDGVATSDTGPMSPDDTTVEADTAPPAPPKSQPAAYKPYSGGDCPTFIDGMNTFVSGGENRKVMMHVPANPQGASVAFLWHGFGDSVSNFSNAFQAQKMSAELNMIIVIPEPIIAVPLMGINSWGIHSFADSAPDLTLFDDTLACLKSNFDINENVVYSAGFSAGALWTSRLVIERSEYLTAAALWSGGTDAAGSVVTIPYSTPKHKLPVLAGHGGSGDQWGGGPILVKFNEGTEDLASRLKADGHPVVLCPHGGGHTVPMGGVEWTWEFLRTHYWSEGESQWIGHSGAPMPNYCTSPAAP